ncbi:MAG TPA: 50S ribosomal protein L21 [Chromatiales bacterium]|nr:50S ribosomal protein L21 [Thiotrichales bacterium]HIP67280.1 50S ribosomal protein L21 [Chromatiales bacterium]
MYAVIATGGKQYKVAEGDKLRIEKLAIDAGKTVEFDKVLLVADGDKVNIGTPYLDGGKVSAKVNIHGRGKKIEIIKFKRRKQYRKQMGHRQDFTEVEITGISAGKGSTSKKTAAPKAAAKPAEAETKPAKAKAKATDAADDLKKISGVGPVIEEKLHKLGITSFSQIAAFTPEEIADVDEKLNFKGRIERDDWLSQAKILAEGGETEFSKKK